MFCRNTWIVCCVWNYNVSALLIDNSLGAVITVIHMLTHDTHAYTWYTCLLSCQLQKDNDTLLKMLVSRNYATISLCKTSSSKRCRPSDSFHSGYLTYRNLWWTEPQPQYQSIRVSIWSSCYFVICYELPRLLPRLGSLIGLDCGGVLDLNDWFQRFSTVAIGTTSNLINHELFKHRHLIKITRIAYLSTWSQLEHWSKQLLWLPGIHLFSTIAAG